MRIHQEVLEHPTQTSLLLLNVYEQNVDKDTVAADDDARGVTGYLVTEDRRGSSNVVKTIGFFRTRDEALACVRERSADLQSQRYLPVAAPSVA